VKNSSLLTLTLSGLIIVGCGGGGGSDNEVSDAPSASTPDDTGSVGSPIEIATPTTFAFDSQFEPGESAVSYTGQTGRLVSIESVVSLILTYTQDDIAAQVEDDLNFFYFGDTALDTTPIGFSIDGVTFAPDNGAGVTTFGSISSGKNLFGKVAGEDTGMDSVELNMTDGLVNEEFFGWNEAGFNATGNSGERPSDFLTYLFGLLEDEVTDGIVPQIDTSAGLVPLNVSYVDGKGRDFRQLIEKFMLGAITFSQGTSDYLQADFSADNIQDGTDPFTVGAHDWDESFGYFGAARNLNDYTDEEIAGNGGRGEYARGFNDTNGDGIIDLTSEINLGNSTNCASRDLGSAGNTNPTDFTNAAFTAYLEGRTVLNQAAAAAAAAAGQVDLTDAQSAAVEAAGDTVATVWEKCIAATVIHYINDVTADINRYDGDTFADLDNYREMATHWSEMMGFALGLQFNAESPIFASDANNADFRQVLELMGEAPVLADGSQNGVAATTAEPVASYLADLQTARDTLERLYGFDSENVANW